MSIHKLVFDATDADTRAASSNVGAYLRASDGTLITNTGGALDVNIKTSDISIDVDLDAATDSIQAWAHDGSGAALTSTSGALDVFIDNASIEVTATDLDIRDLTHVSDSTKVGDGIDFLAINTDGSINTVEASATALLAVAETVGTTAAAIVDGGDELANRRKLYIFNNSNKNTFIGSSAVSTANGFPVPPGAILELSAGAAMDVYMIGEAANLNVRTLQIA